MRFEGAAAAYRRRESWIRSTRSRITWAAIDPIRKSLLSVASGPKAEGMGNSHTLSPTFADTAGTSPAGLKPVKEEYQEGWIHVATRGLDVGGGAQRGLGDAVLISLCDDVTANGSVVRH